MWLSSGVIALKTFVYFLSMIEVCLFIYVVSGSRCLCDKHGSGLSDDILEQTRPWFNKAGVSSGLGNSRELSSKYVRSPVVLCVFQRPFLYRLFGHLTEPTGACINDIAITLS